MHVLNCFTQSVYAPFSDVESLHANDRASFVSAVRKREDAAWLKLLGGRVQMTDLDLLDAPLRLVCDVSEVLTIPIRVGDRAVARISGAIAKLARSSSSSESAFVLPLAVGEHIDHRVVRQAALEALTGSPVSIAFYEDLPYAARPDGPEQVMVAVSSTGIELQPAFASDPTLDVPAAVARKGKVAECYDSQVDSETVEQIASFTEQYGGRERLWVNAAWTQSPLMHH